MTSVSFSALLYCIHCLLKKCNSNVTFIGVGPQVWLKFSTWFWTCCYWGVIYTCRAILTLQLSTPVPQKSTVTENETCLKISDFIEGLTWLLLMYSKHFSQASWQVDCCNSSLGWHWEMQYLKTDYFIGTPFLVSSDWVLWNFIPSSLIDLVFYVSLWYFL